MRPRTSVRTSPRSSATMLEPSFTTRQPIAEQVRRGRGPAGCSPPRVTLKAGIELEHHSPDLHVVAGLEAFGLERVDHPDPPQPALEVCEGLLVVQVIACEQPLDPRAADPEAAAPAPLDTDCPVGSRTEDAMLGQVLD